MRLKIIFVHSLAWRVIDLDRQLRGNPFITPIDEPVMVAAAEAYEDTYGEWPVYTRSGGSIPIVEVLGRVLDAPVVLAGLWFTW